MSKGALQPCPPDDVVAEATQFTFVYRPGGVAGGNVYTDLPTLMAARALVEGPALIEVDDSIAPAVAPAFAYDFTDTRVIGDRGRAVGLTELEFADGATITVFPPRSESIRYFTASTSPVFTTAGGPALGLDDATLERRPAATAPFVALTAGTLNLFCKGGGLGGATPVVDVAAGATLALAIDWSGLILQDTVSGTGTVQLVIRSPANFVFNTFSGPVFTGTLLTILQSKSVQALYTPAVPGNWIAPAPGNVNSAIDRMAAVVAGAHGPIP